eukprot:PhM_4_TR17813/c0_g1_i1/m.30264
MRHHPPFPPHLCGDRDVDVRFRNDWSSLALGILCCPLSSALVSLHLNPAVDEAPHMAPNSAVRNACAVCPHLVCGVCCGAGHYQVRQQLRSYYGFVESSPSSSSSSLSRSNVTDCLSFLFCPCLFVVQDLHTVRHCRM